jgi:hypothetical protein
MSYRLPDVLIKERNGAGLMISLVFVAICAAGVCRALQLVQEGQGGAGTVTKPTPVDSTLE